MRGLVSDQNTLTFANDVSMPPPAEPGEVLVRVISATLNPSDPQIAAGAWDGFVPGSDKRRVRTGFEFAGEVAASGGGFHEGDRVYGYVDILGAREWAHQEYVVISAACIARMPKRLDFDHAASVPLAAQTVLEALRDIAKVQPSERVLVIGATGGLGVMAVPIAKVLGAHVTAVAGKGESEFLTSLGADAVIDRHATPLRSRTETYDIIFDLSTSYRHADIAHLLAEGARFLPADPMKNAEDLAQDTSAAASTREVLVLKGRRRDLEQVASWIDTHRISTHVDTVFNIEDIAAALERLNARGKRGRIVLRVTQSE